MIRSTYLLVAFPTAPELKIANGDALSNLKEIRNLEILEEAMSKSWGRLAREELLAWGKAGGKVGLEMTHTTINEIGKVAGHKGSKFEFHTKIAMRELVKQTKTGR